MLVRRVAALRQVAPRGARLLAQQAYAVTPYRELASATAAQREAWAAQDELLHARMKEHVPAALEHNGEESFANHLVGVQSVLRSWSASETLCNAALFHSIYGTEGFQGYKLPLSHREEIAGLIGPEAERLAWIFCMVDRASVDASVLRGADSALEERSFRSRISPTSPCISTTSPLHLHAISTMSPRSGASDLALSSATLPSRSQVSRSGSTSSHSPLPTGSSRLGLGVRG